MWETRVVDEGHRCVRTGTLGLCERSTRRDRRDVTESTNCGYKEYKDGEELFFFSFSTI